MSEKPSVYVTPGEAPPSELLTEDLEVGSGDEAVSGKGVEVHYVGVSWQSLKQFDASWDRGDTFRFNLGAGQVIKGWDQGVAGMRVGGRRRITIPPNRSNRSPRTRPLEAAPHSRRHGPSARRR